MRCSGMWVFLTLLLLLLVASASLADVVPLSDREMANTFGAAWFQKCDWPLGCSAACMEYGGGQWKDMVPRDAAKSCMSPGYSSCSDSKPSVKCGEWRRYPGQCDHGGVSWWLSDEFTGPACAG